MASKRSKSSNKDSNKGSNKTAARALKGLDTSIRPDTLDFRDQMFVPTLVEVPSERTVAHYRKQLGKHLSILDQGEEGACTGFALATVCHYLLRTRQVKPDYTSISPDMLYETAKLYDEWRGEDYVGSSARGAMKAWQKHGVCSLKLWPLSDQHAGKTITLARAEDAASRPLGAYFRVNHQDIVAMHAALAEVGILFVTCLIHKGWGKLDKQGRVTPKGERVGAHAFAIVGYDTDGFWFQNSWGGDWGNGGFGHLSYADWLDNGMDAWVARLGAPVKIADGYSTGAKSGGIATAKLSYPELRPHLISVGNDGLPRNSGTYGNSAEDIKHLLQAIPERTQNWKKRRILLYAHGGLVPESNAIQRVENYLPALLKAEVYPLAFIWKTDAWSTIKNLLNDALKQRRSEGVLDAAKDFMLDRLDDSLEPIARLAGGKKLWDEMKENALLSSLRAEGAARLVCDELATLCEQHDIELHIAGHSAGSIFMAPVVQRLCSQGALAANTLHAATELNWDNATGLNLSIKTVTLWAAACTTELFDATYLPAIAAKQIERFTLFNLSDDVERDDNCAGLYHKSLLYLVSNAFEKSLRSPFKKDGQGILGMDKFVTQHAQLQKHIKQKRVQYVVSPNKFAEGSCDATRAKHHGDFDDDTCTVKATLARILGATEVKAEFNFPRSAASMRDRRKALMS